MTSNLSVSGVRLDKWLGATAWALAFAGIAIGPNLYAQNDPGVRNGAPGAGGPIAGLTPGELAAFNTFMSTFTEVDSVATGLGPGYNLDSCTGCHAQPAAGGSSPAINPQIAAATRNSANNTVPRFLSQNGPVREVRFVQNPDGSPDGGVHDLFSIQGRHDAPGCQEAQTDFSNTSNLRFRIPTPTFGGGLIESIPDSVILSNLASNNQIKRGFGISGHVNTTGNDGTVTRFGWKAQNKSLTVFAGEAYNVEQGVTNEVFPNERNWNPTCMYNGTPEDHTNYTTNQASDVEAFATVMRFLAPPKPVTIAASTSAGQSTSNGLSVFNRVGCALCHTPTLTTGKSFSAALTNQPVNLYSDLAVHGMGQGLADNITQGSAQGDEFRTAPLWGLGQRIFFLHDGRTKDLMQAIQDHASRNSEANTVIQLFNSLHDSDQQDLLNFLRSL
jgi:CxxC motif-containing protein (DUF1111 family)